MSSAYWHDEPGDRLGEARFRRLLSGPSHEQVRPYLDMPHSALAERCCDAEAECRRLVDKLDHVGERWIGSRLREVELEERLERPYAPWWTWAMSGAGVMLAYERAGWTWALFAVVMLALAWWTISAAIKEDGQ